MSIEVKEFIKDPKYTDIKTFYKETLAKVGELETIISNLDDVYLPLTGGTLTGDLTTTQTEFNTQSFVTKQWVQENTVTGSFLPSTGGIIQGENSNGKLSIYDKYLNLERYDNNERVSYVYLTSGGSRDSFVPGFTMNTTKPFTYNGTTINYYQNQISTSGYSWNLGSENIYIFPTGIELVSNGLQNESSSMKQYGQINLNLNGLEIQERDANYTLTHNLKLYSGTNTAQVYLYVDDGKNKWAQFNVDGLNFGGTDQTLDSLYFNTDGVGYTTKETNGRQVQYFTTRWSHTISYKNQTETGTIEFKPITTDGEVQFKIANTIDNTTHEVIIYNGHTSTTQTSFNNDDYITKSYIDTSIGNYLPLIGGTLTGSLNINTTSTASDSFAIADLSDTAIRAFNVGNDFSYSYKTVTSGQVSAERKFEVGYNKFEYSGENNQLKIASADITIKTNANNKFENKLGSSSYMNFYNNDYNYLYMGTSPNTSGNMIDWIVAGFKLQLNASSGSLYKQANGFNSTLTSTSYSAQFNSAGGNSNRVSINGTDISWQGAQKASYSNPNYDTVNFSIDQNGFDYTGNWYSSQSATDPVQLRIYSGANNALLYISHSAPNANNTYISISDQTNDTTISMGCNNGSNYSSVNIGGSGISLNKGLNNSFTHFSAGGGDLETSKDYTGFRFNLTDTSKIKGLTAFKANGVDVDFTIEGFHDIINDKFTLSNTYDTTATGELTQDEIDWINTNSKDILAMIMDIKRSGSGTDVVTRAEYNELLNAYNDLAERLNIFLQNTGNVPIEPTGNALKTKALDTTQLSICEQNADNDFTIDWGDGTTDLSGSNGTIINHNYAETDNYTIQIIPNNDDAIGEIVYSVDDILEVYFQDKVKLDDEYAFIGDDVLKKIVIDNALLYWGSNSGFIMHSTSIEEVHIGKNCTYTPTNLCFIWDCSALTKLTIDMPIVDYEGDFIDECPNLTEVHLTSTTMPTFIDDGKLFGTIPDDLVIYVPNDLLNDYKTALPNYASYIQGE